MLRCPAHAAPSVQRARRFDAAILVVTLALAPRLTAQAPTGSPAQPLVRGTVVSRETRLPVAGVSVQVGGTNVVAFTHDDGRYAISGIAPGTYTLTFRRIGFEPATSTVAVGTGALLTVNAELAPVALRLSDVIVRTASRVPERIVQAPAAITVIPSYEAAAAAPTNQVATVLRQAPGFDVVQNGMNDFNINARGFNSALNRRVLVLQDGRDLSFAFLGAQEWPAIAGSLDELGKIEVVRGPGSALYGPNAFNGIVNITTPAARDAIGSKLNVTTGELHTFRADMRHAESFAEGRFAFKVTGGINKSDTYARSRTRFDSTDIVREYSAATSSPIAKQRAEAMALRGQTIDRSTGIALGDRDPLRSIYGVSRLDYYSPKGGVATVESGLSQTENELFVTTIGRVQVYRALRPYARMNWGTDDYYITGYFSGRRTPDAQRALASGAPLLEFSETYHLEGQTNRRFDEDRGRLIAGASARAQHVDTRSTLIAPEDDDRVDRLYSAFVQVEYGRSTKLKTVVGARVDDGNLYHTQISPKVALVFAPTEVHSFRATINRAFQPPNPAERFLHVPAGAPTAGPQSFEKGIESYFAAIRSSLTAAGYGGQVAALNLPVDLPYNFAAVTPVFALGNRGLRPQTIVGYELGYRGELPRKWGGYFTADVYLNEKRDFVTALLGGVNPNYPPLLTANGINLLQNLDDITALVGSTSLSASTKASLLASQPALRGGYTSLASLATRLSDGTPALVLSYANAGRVEERGVELASGFQVGRGLRADLTYTHFEFQIKRATLPGDRLVPNTPKNKGSLMVTYSGVTRLDAGASVRFVQSSPWLAGVFDGVVPAAQIVNANAGYRITANLKALVVCTNLLDQQRFELYGGSVNGRRLLGGLTAAF